jgi:hypothetical protein
LREPILELTSSASPSALPAKERKPKITIFVVKIMMQDVGKMRSAD